MDSTTDTTLPNSPLGIIKTVLLFIGRTILVALGLLVIASTVIDTFEESLSFLEISTLEMVFYVVFFFLLKNYIVETKRHNIGWRQTLYRPLRNLGWYGVLSFSVVIFILFKTGKIDLSMEDANTEQIINFIIVAFCIYLAMPKDADNQHDTAMEGSAE